MICGENQAGICDRDSGLVIAVAGGARVAGDGFVLSRGNVSVVEGVCPAIHTHIPNEAKAATPSVRRSAILRTKDRG
jgi:hypothetical protein